MRILVRLPNWLGDFVMSTAFITALRRHAPDAEIHAIIKRELSPLAAFVPELDRVFPFSKPDAPGLLGLSRYARQLRQDGPYDVAFVLPESFSSALLARQTGARERIGFAKELRSFLLTRAVPKPKGRHRVQEYAALLEAFTGDPPGELRVALPDSQAASPPDPAPILLNFNSEAQSRRIPVGMARDILSQVLDRWDRPVQLTGSPKETAHSEAIAAGFDPRRVTNLAGKTGLMELVATVREAALVLSPDSGVAHVTNAVGTPLVVLCGASNEHETGPYNPGSHRVLRAPGLECAPCVANTCRFGTPKCMLQLEISRILEAIEDLLPSR
mgnify:CR=1 FL=1